MATNLFANSGTQPLSKQITISQNSSNIEKKCPKTKGQLRLRTKAAGGWLLPVLTSQLHSLPRLFEISRLQSSLLLAQAQERLKSRGAPQSFFRLSPSSGCLPSVLVFLEAVLAANLIAASACFLQCHAFKRI